MPIKNYGVLMGKASNRVRATASDEHFHILVNHGNHPQRISINTKSTDAPSQVLYYATDDFHHEITDAILQANLKAGFTPIVSQPGTLALDFIRRNLFDTSAMVPLPAQGSPGDNNDLNDRIDFFVQQAINDASAVVYAFGQHWQDASGADKYFPEINPSTGVHDIHMNQGNPHGSFFADNGVWQDGGLLFHFASRNRWAAAFTAFQSQSFHTDDKTGDPISVPTPPPSTQQVSIVAAMVNPVGDDIGKEYVILLNKSNTDIDLFGWQIADKLKHKDVIGKQVIPAGGTLHVSLTGTGAQLSNKGGNITLLNKDNLKIDGVTYTQKDAAVEGQLVEF